MNQSRILPPLPQDDFQDEQDPQLIMDAIDYLNTKKLLSLSKYVMQGGRALVEFVDYNRTAARQAGVETIAVELSGIIDSGKIQSVYDSLHEAAFSGRDSKLSREGLTYLRRSERLLAEATSNLVRFSGVVPGNLGLGKGNFSLGAAEPAAFPTTLVIIGTIGTIIAIIILLAILLRK
jgi:hypothetical protein